MREYQLRRSNRKTLSLEITEELAVLVRAPQHTPPERIERFVQELSLIHISEPTRPY